MDYNVLDALAMITREKNVDRSIVIESLVAGLQSAARKKLGAETVIYAQVDENTGSMTVEQVKTLHEAAAGQIEVKASGGIRTLAQCREFIIAGATRLGSSSSVEIMKELQEAS